MHEAVARCERDVTALVDDLFSAILPSEEAFAALMDLVERRIASALAGRTTAPPACAPGCAACCSVQVGTLAIEGAAAASYLRRKVGPDGAPGFARELLAFHDRVRWLEDEERIRARLACPFLDAARACTIHPVRPLACRAVSSLDPAECRRALEERGSEEGAGTVQMDLLQWSLYETALGAIARALSARGLDGRLRDVTGMAGAFLADGGLAAAYGAGSPVPIE